MALQTTLPIGRAFTMASGVVYALPSASLKYFSQGSGTLQVSNDGSTWATPGADLFLSGKYARANSNDLIIILLHQ